jgi:hypothetical protein
VEFESPDPAAASPPGSCPRGGGHRGRAAPYGQGGANGATDWYRRHPGLPCHQRAIHSGLDRCRAVTHGQQHGGFHRCRSMSSQAAILPDLALQARGRLVEGCIGLAVPGRPIGPWSRRTGAPQASATGRDRNPGCSRDCSRDAPRHAGMSGYRTGRDETSAFIQLGGLVEARSAPASTARAQFRSRWGNPWGFESPRSHTLPTRAIALHLLPSPTGGLAAFCQRFVNGMCRLLVAVAQDQPRHRVGCLGAQAGQT